MTDTKGLQLHTEGSHPGTEEPQFRFGESHDVLALRLDDPSLSPDDERFLNEHLQKSPARSSHAHRSEHFKVLRTRADGQSGFQKLYNVLRYFSKAKIEASAWQSKILQDYPTLKDKFSTVVTCLSESEPEPDFLCFFTCIFSISSGDGKEAEDYKARLATLGSTEPLQMVDELKYFNSPSLQPCRRRDAQARRRLEDAFPQLSPRRYHGVLIPYDGDDSGEFPPIEITQLVINIDIALANAKKYGRDKAKVAMGMVVLEEICQVHDLGRMVLSIKGRNRQSICSHRKDYRLLNDRLYYIPAKSRNCTANTRQEEWEYVVPMEHWHRLLIALHKLAICSKKEGHGGRDKMKDVITKQGLKGPGKELINTWLAACSCGDEKSYGPRARQAKAKGQSPQSQTANPRAEKRRGADAQIDVGSPAEGQRPSKKRKTKGISQAMLEHTTPSPAVGGQSQPENAALHSPEALMPTPLENLEPFHDTLPAPSWSAPNPYPRRSLSTPRWPWAPGHEVSAFPIHTATPESSAALATRRKRASWPGDLRSQYQGVVATGNIGGITGYPTGSQPVPMNGEGKWVRPNDDANTMTCNTNNCLKYNSSLNPGLLDSDPTFHRDGNVTDNAYMVENGNSISEHPNHHDVVDGSIGQLSGQSSSQSESRRSDSPLLYREEILPEDSRGMDREAAMEDAPANFAGMNPPFSSSDPKMAPFDKYDPGAEEGEFDYYYSSLCPSP